ncbi:MAG TPA: F0F1 ATP synthase subunit delta [Candidatus Sulfomarinibacteraceae bacterium]|nr:F0F1 ATP synthase subunit delta [Candidatus Sulfomarinibacteraceae bacterium]
MQIDWFTLLAEIVNFVILVYLLKRFLYDPILGIADAREEEIASRFEEAEAKAAEAQEEATAFRQERQEFEAQRQDLLEQARRAAEEERRRSMAQVRQEVEEERAEWRRQLARQRETFLQALQQQASEEVYAVAGRVVADLADADLQEEIIEQFLVRLREMPAPEVDDLRRELGDGGVEVITAFPLSAAERRKIREALDEMLATHKPKIRFSEDGELICGIALRIDGRKVTWNVQSYLDGLQEKVDVALKEAIAEETGQERGVVDE